MKCTGKKNMKHVNLITNIHNSMMKAKEKNTKQKLRVHAK